MLTRAQFDTLCKALVQKYAPTSTWTVATAAYKGWTWNEHALFPGFGFLSRTVLSHILAKVPGECIDTDTNEEMDEATAVTESVHESLTCQQYIVYSATFQVPSFYFNVSDSNGTPLSLDRLVETSLFQRSVFDGTEFTTFGISQPPSSFPLLSQGEHPTLGTPSWYLHPCETERAVDELMRERGSDGSDWLEIWFVVVGAVIHWV